jgi:hypothetical protein
VYFPKKFLRATKGVVNISGRPMKLFEMEERRNKKG